MKQRAARGIPALVDLGVLVSLGAVAWEAARMAYGSWRLPSWGPDPEILAAAIDARTRAYPWVAALAVAPLLAFAWWRGGVPERERPRVSFALAASVVVLAAVAFWGSRSIRGFSSAKAEQDALERLMLAKLPVLATSVASLAPLPSPWSQVRGVKSDGGDGRHGAYEIEVRIVSREGGLLRVEARARGRALGTVGPGAWAAVARWIPERPS